MSTAVKDAPVGQIEKNVVYTGIEKGVPLPKYTKMPKDELTEKMKKMDIKDSAVVDKEFNDKTLNALRTKVNDICKREKSLKNKRFTVNVDPKTETSDRPLLRVWRVQ